MGTTRLSVRRLGVFLGFLLLMAKHTDGQSANATARINQSIDEKNVVTLHGNVHPLARSENDQGLVSDATTMSRILLLLLRSTEQEAFLQQLMSEQMSKGSPNFHKWLTPQQFGQQFGPADGDVQSVMSWLSSHGFTNMKVNQGRTIIEFSGNAGQVRNAFHTEIHRYLVKGVEKIANASDPQIPAALASVVSGVVSLTSFRPISHRIPVGTFFRSKATGEVKPLFTPAGSQSFFPLAPGDFATIYNSAPLLSANPKIDGTGQTIAVAGESDINVQDIVDFRNLFGLAQNFSGKNIIINGPDPGFNASEGESDLDVQWSGAVAPGATIDFVTSASTETSSGVHLSAIYIVDNNIAPVMSESFGECEQHLGSIGNQFFNSLWQQAAAQGITVILSAGDSGSAGCDDFETQETATQGIAVSGFASTPFNIAVGGTDFDQFNNWTQYWSFTNAPVTQASAKGYIPEIPWNDSCAQIGIGGCGASAPSGSLNIQAGSGGPSTVYSKPSWQSGTGVPNDGKRDVPDVSLFASNSFTGSVYIICQADVVSPPNPTCGLSNFGFTYQGVGGTSAAAPAFAGIMALVNQGQASTANPAPRQGNANYVLYALAKKTGASCPSGTSEATSCIFNDITKGNSNLPTGGAGAGTNSVPCQGGTSNCSVSSASTNGVLVTSPSSNAEAWSVGAGYDLTTGLGSVNAENLVNNWSSVAFSPSATSLSVSVSGNQVTSIGGISHGTPVGISSTVTGTGGTPTGQVALVATPNPIPSDPSSSLVIEALSLVNGAATSSSVILPGGTYSLNSHYQGDQTFGPSDSSPAVTVNITIESSKTLISVPVFDPTTGKETGNTPKSIAYGSSYRARFDVGNSSASLTFPEQALCTPPNCPSGTVTVTDSLNGGTSTPLDAGTFPLNSSGFAEDSTIQLPGGSHVLSANYSGDNSFGASSSTYTLTITPGATRIILSNPPLPSTVATPFNLQVILTMGFFGAMPSCNFTFYDGTNALQGTPSCRWQANGPFLYVTFPISQTTVGAHTYTAKFNGDSNYAPSTSGAMTTSVFYGTTTTLSADSINVQYGTSVTLTALVDSTISKSPKIPNAVTFYYNNDPISGTVSYTPVTDSSGNLELRASISFVPQFSSFAAAMFNGDSNYSQSGSTILNITVNIPDFNVAANLPSPTITAGSSATATVTVTPTSGASSPVTLTCPTLDSLGQAQPPGITCSFSPGTVNLSNGIAGSSTLTISTLAPSSSTTTSAAPLVSLPYFTPRFSWRLLPACLLALILFVLLLVAPSRLRGNFGGALASCVLLFLGFVGCGGGSTGGGGGGAGGGGGPASTSITLSASSLKVPYTSSSGGNVNLTANVTSSKTAGGTVTFVVDGNSNYFETPSPVVSGVAQILLQGMTVGTHNVSALYSGDANTLKSQTNGGLNIAVTGQALLTVMATTGGTVHLADINFTLQ